MTRALSVVSLLLLAGFARAQSPGDRALGILEQGLRDAKEDRGERAALALALLVGDEHWRELAETALSDRSPAVLRIVHRHDGSLTTPPGSEGVKWLVMTTPIQLSTEQIGTFTAIEGNNRPVQPFNDRPVVTNRVRAES